MDKNWCIVEPKFDSVTSRAYEGLFTIGSGYLHVRGSLEEHLLDAPQNLDYTRRPANVTAEKFLESKSRWGTYIPGVRGNHPLLNRSLVNLPFFLEIAPSVSGEKLDMETSSIVSYQRVLRLDTGTLQRSFTWQTHQGVNLNLTYERFISALRPQLCVQQLQITPDRDVTITIQAGIDADIRTFGYDMFATIELQPQGSSGIHCHVVTNTGDEVWMMTNLLIHESTHVINPGSPTDQAQELSGFTDLEIKPWLYSSEKRTARLSLDLVIPAGRTIVVEKRTAAASSFDPPDFLSPAAVLTGAQTQSYAELYSENANLWHTRWEKCDVLIEGDDSSQLALRASLYHLLRAHPNDPRLAIDPKGYAGDAYRGCYFWDTEMFMLPFFLYTDPARARSLLEYRIHSLPGAQANAKNTGYIGARYAWEADIDGTETCPNWQYRDHEVHVTADVVYGLAHYAALTKDRNFLTGPAAQVILETARYWVDRVDWRKGDEYPSLLGVMGPDEYTPISNNNSFTNRIVAFGLTLAADLGPMIGADFMESRRFARIASGLRVLRQNSVTGASNNLVMQCEGFESMAEPAFDRFWLDRSQPFAAQAAQEWLYRSKCLKQADVLMLMMLFPDEFTSTEVRLAWDYYVPYTTHDSSLSAGTHAIIACRLGKNAEAYQFWKRSSGIDLDFLHGGAAEGVHMACAGLNWQTVIFGFGGLTSVLNSEIILLNPHLPDSWSRLVFPIIWKGTPLMIDIDPTRTIVKNNGSRAIEVMVDDHSLTIGPGKEGLWN